MIFFSFSILGLLKNIVKYKQVSISLFFRTPIICYFLHYVYLSLTQVKLNPLLIVILERYLMFLYKISKSIITNSYNKKKNKYRIKYQLSDNLIVW